MRLPALNEVRLAVVGLGYVGLPLAAAFARHLPVLGLDRDAGRISELETGHDRTGEVDTSRLAPLLESGRLCLSADPADLASCNVYIACVPTPVDQARRPDLGPLRAVSGMIARALAPGDVVIYESTVYPGATEEVCIPLLEQGSGLVCNQDFSVGYSPERINPADPEHGLANIVKVTSGSCAGAARFVDRLYRLVARAGTHPAPSIRVAEAAKVIENTQRDLNIALVNELAMLFGRLGLDTGEVLEAARTKWNFCPFEPGLVGGHCIGVDPYYLTHKAQECGYHPEIILAGRRINDSMPQYVAARVVKLMLGRGMDLPRSRVLILGLAFKDNCADLRNTKVIDLARELESFGLRVLVHDPLADPAEARRLFGLDLVEEPAPGCCDALVLAVAHRVMLERKAAWFKELVRPPAVVYDIRRVLPRDMVTERL